MPERFIIKVEHILQEDDGTCLAACAQAVLAYWGVFHSQNELNRLFGFIEGGVPLSRLSRLEQYGVKVDIRPGEENDLYTYLEQQIPLTLFVRTDQLTYWQYDTRHAVVVVGYEGEYVLVNDPAFEDAPIRILADELFLAWSEFDYTLAVISQ